MTKRTITIVVDHPLEWNTRSAVTPLVKSNEIAGLLLTSYSISAIVYNKVTVIVFVNCLWQKGNNQSSQHDRNTLHYQQVHSECRVFRCDSGTKKVRQTSGHGNPQYYSGRWSGSYYVPGWAAQNELSRSAKQHRLIAQPPKILLDLRIILQYRPLSSTNCMNCDCVKKE